MKSIAFRERAIPTEVIRTIFLSHLLEREMTTASKFATVSDAVAPAPTEILASSSTLHGQDAVAHTPTSILKEDASVSHMLQPRQ
ncbi:hypothetical protein RRG08_051546 [Elysia crispata]|uniref:Uncharacterized protein n=1 Tax=Elysia crispata TaxID=231223 RepID=A0AAE0Y9P5_9GAST|nr:hypothetical protein RRG08_051546 [Elysia crispata]